MSRNVKIVPAILTDNTLELNRMVGVGNECAPLVQMDIMDGLFVPSRSVGMDDLGKADIRFKWEAHLMVAHPLRYLETLREIGAARIIFHIESEDNAGCVISGARSLGMGVGVAVNPPTRVADVASLLGRIDSVLLMTVYPGYYGAPFVPEVMSKVGQVREAHPEVQIAVDGGINESNLVEVARHGVDTICIGSAIFRSANPAASYCRFVSLARQA